MSWKLIEFFSSRALKWAQTCWEKNHISDLHVTFLQRSFKFLHTSVPVIRKKERYLQNELQRAVIPRLAFFPTNYYADALPIFAFWISIPFYHRSFVPGSAGRGQGGAPTVYKYARSFCFTCHRSRNTYLLAKDDLRYRIPGPDSRSLLSQERWTSNYWWVSLAYFYTWTFPECGETLNKEEVALLPKNCSFKTSNELEMTMVIELWSSEEKEQCDSIKVCVLFLKFIWFLR